MPGKTEIYTWRVSAAVKSRLEEAARVRRRSVAQILDELVTEGRDNTDCDSGSDVERQGHLHAQARRFLGACRDVTLDEANAFESWFGNDC